MSQSIPLDASFIGSFLDGFFFKIVSKISGAGIWY